VFELLSLMRMRGLGVMWSPDSPGCDAMTPRTEPGNPEARKSIHNYLQLTTNDCLGETLKGKLAKIQIDREEYDTRVNTYLQPFTNKCLGGLNQLYFTRMHCAGN